MLALRIVRYVTWAAIGVLSAALLYLLMAPRPEGSAGVAIGGPFRLTAGDGSIVESEKI